MAITERFKLWSKCNKFEKSDPSFSIIVHN